MQGLTTNKGTRDKLGSKETMGTKKQETKKQTEKQTKKQTNKKQGNKGSQKQPAKQMNQNQKKTN